MKYALVIDGVVDAISMEQQEEPWVEVEDDVFAGFTANESGGFDAPPAGPAPVPPSLTFPQLLFGLVSEGVITREEATNWLIGRVLPAEIQQAISSLPEQSQILFLARALQPTEISRNDPMLLSLASVKGKSSSELDDFFRAYSQA